ncbi:crAss001_48 related protein [Klebsiella quasipneumoniae]|uniref:crAss001_48 related protein n=1 Tax=Klebsiella quasipneumoniae TaxID=1463165 RepID=UPI00352B9A58
MQPHQQRVVDEATELKDKATKLNSFISGNPVFSTLTPLQQGLLKAQVGAMNSYLEILNLRIASF